MDPDQLLAALDSRVAELRLEWPPAARRREVASELGGMVRQLREWRGWNEHKLAKRVDMNMGAVLRLEAGQKLVGMRDLTVIAKVLREGEWVPPGS